MRPVVGITTYVEPASWGVWHDLETALVPHAYVEAVTRAGGRAVLLPPDDLDPDVLRVVDALVLSGGADLGPELYGAEREPLTDTRPGRDAAELPLARAALAADLPVLGVCRGMQVMAVAAGGSLHQHLPDVIGHEGHRAAPGTDPLAAAASAYGRHDVVLKPGSEAQALLGSRITVNSFHHQAVDDSGTFTAVGWCPEDRVIEIIENPRLTFALGVQWHPERTADLRVFAALAEAAAGRSGLGREALAA